MGRVRWWHRMGRCVTSGKGSSTVEYVVLLAAGVLVASLLFAALSDGSIQQELKRKVMQALNGEQIATNSGQAPPDSGNKQENQASNHASPSPAPKEAGFFGGLWDAGGKLLDDTGQWFKDIYEKDIKGIWNDPWDYFLETVGWEGIKDSWNKAWDDPGQYFKDAWENTVEGWNQFWDDPLLNTAKIVFDWDQFAESWSGKDEDGNQIPILNRVWGVAESLPLPTKVLKVVSVADGIFIHDGCAKKKGSPCKKGKNSGDEGKPDDKPKRLTPGTPEHKEARWKEYKENGGEWGYDRWSSVYESNMKRAKTANQAMDDYWQRIGGWGKREVTVDAGGKDRRLDIADVGRKKGIEHKTTTKEDGVGYFYLSDEIKSELERDAFLVQNKGWEITWVFENATASKPLLEELKKHGIQVKIIEKGGK